MGKPMLLHLKICQFVTSVAPTHYLLILKNDASQQFLTVVIFAQGREFCSFVAFRNIHDGFCDAADTQRAKKLGSDNFIDKLHYPLGFLYLSSIITPTHDGKFVRFLEACCGNVRILMQTVSTK